MDKRNLDAPFPPSHVSFSKVIVIYAIVSRDVLLKHLRYRDFWEKSKYQGLLTFRIRYKVLKREGNLSLLALTSVNISQDILFCIGFIKHLKLNRTWMRSDNALLMPVSPMILSSRICPRFIFPSFPYSSKTSSPNSSCKCHLLKPFYFTSCMSPNRGSPCG